MRFKILMGAVFSVLVVMTGGNADRATGGPSAKADARSALQTESRPAGQASTKYGVLMIAAESRDTLRNLALWEDQRVTGDGILFDYLASSNPLVRLRAVEVIGRIQDPIDIDRLLPMLADSDRRVVNETLFALGQIGADTASSAVVEFCGQAKGGQLVLGVEALGKTGGKEASAFLMETLHNFQSRIRGEAALALARADDPTTVPALLIAIHDLNAGVTWRAIYALEEAQSGRAVESIPPFLTNSDPLVRQFAARTLGKQKYEKAVGALAVALRDGDLRVVVNSARALGEIGNDDAAHPLGEVVTEHSSHHARKAAAEALGDIGSKKGKDYLIRALMDESAGVRATAVQALAKSLGNGSEVFITQLLSDGSRSVRATALECYGTAEITSKIPLLMEEAEESADPMVRAAAVRALAKLEDDRIGPFLVKMLSDRDWVVVTEAVTAVGEQDFRPATGDVVKLYGSQTRREDVNVRLAILSVFGQWKPVEAEGLLREALQSPDKRVRTSALEILTDMGVEPGELKSDREFYEENFDRTRRRALSAPLGLRRAVIVCRHGDIELELFGDDAIQTVANFINLAGEGFFNGLTFHRVVPNFVIQGGDPRGDGWGDAGYFIRSEFNQHRYGEGYVGIAHDGKDTGGSQFFITLSPQHHLDGRYTIFGRVTRGMDVVLKIDQGDTFEVRILD
jgi:HEAT repeat protein/cyclophilin family peptidyl-prolyl cis-trans isomerase